ncbi:hypothetical protein SPBR_01805 [Sporothrix brasiliensis 5110]|uniref:HRQ family protein 2 n=1 Tax=Sporothrix brasiliensis 5110 TaxID=1398154 RepID=A0A0C2FLK8_9PEZI|nr:uncharacterized protein SPBR_01805 [Sporothrix brasiliensis 5110]KIH91973.1 hypothetical protein SPBR_01805 [Sporothrix brasiliensis 5110]
MDLYLIVLLVSTLVVGLCLKQRNKKPRSNEAVGRSAEKSANDGKITPPPSITPLPAFDYTTVRPARFRPYKPAYHITMALQSSLPEDLIVLDSNYRARIETRRRLMESNPNIVMGTIGTPGAKAAVDELYAYLMDYLPARYSSIFTRAASTASLHNAATGQDIPRSPPTNPLDALRTLGETVEDDLFLLQEEGIQTPAGDGGSAYPETSHRLVAFLCCFPSGFDPSAKLGLLLRDIHKPVPSYDKIGPSMERFFKRLAVGQSVRRLNWSVQTHANLFVPNGNHVHKGDDAENDTDVDIAQTHLRVECQTLTRLPATKSILFSFKTHLFPLQDLKSECVGPDLADAIEGLKKGNAPGMWTYKGGVRWGKAVCEYLRS